MSAPVKRPYASGKWEIRHIFFKEISSSISLKNQSPRLSANHAGLGMKNRGKRFFIPKVCLISHFPEVHKKKQPQRSSLGGCCCPVVISF
jgi:hypothetical protein